MNCYWEVKIDFVYFGSVSQPIISIFKDRFTFFLAKLFIEGSRLPICGTCTSTQLKAIRSFSCLKQKDVQQYDKHGTVVSKVQLMYLKDFILQKRELNVCLAGVGYLV